MITMNFFQKSGNDSKAQEFSKSYVDRFRGNKSGDLNAAIKKKNSAPTAGRNPFNTPDSDDDRVWTPEHPDRPGAPKPGHNLDKREKMDIGRPSFPNDPNKGLPKPKRGEAKSRSQQVIKTQGMPNTAGINTSAGNQQNQNTNQDNDINSTVSGDNNYVYNTQDNSIRQYGGDNRSLTINSDGKGSLMDSMDGAATAGTLAGLWDADDSPGAKASRLAQHSDMNKQMQKKYANTSHIAQGAISRAAQNSFINPRELDNRIHERSMYHRAKSTTKGASIFGDLYGLEGPDWKSAKPAKPVEKPDFEKMYDTYTDF